MDKTGLETLKERYLKHLAVLNYATSTIRKHLFHLKHFFLYLTEQKIHDISSVTHQTIADYQMRLYQAINKKGAPNTVSSQNNALQTVKSFFRCLAENDYIAGNPAGRISYARRPQKLPRSPLTQNEIKKLLHAPDTRSIIGYRDRTILELLYSTGIRKKEINNLKLTDLDTTQGLLRINHGKGDRDRVVPVGRIACRYLENYIQGIRPELISDPYNHYLFLSLRGNRLSKNTVWEIVKRYARQSRIKKSISPHTLRHTFATEMLKNKANIRHIQEILGHASLQSTQVYTHLGITDLKEVHARCHPREKDKE